MRFFQQMPAVASVRGDKHRHAKVERLLVTWLGKPAHRFMIEPQRDIRRGRSPGERAAQAATHLKSQTHFKPITCGIAGEVSDRIPRGEDAVDANLIQQLLIANREA